MTSKKNNTTTTTTTLPKGYYQHLGHLELGVPEFGIFVSAEKNDWFTNVHYDVYDKESEIVTAYESDWDVFEDTLCNQNLKNCINLKKHYNTITFEINPESKLDKDFGFYINNKCNDDNHALMYVFSWQEKKMVFGGYSVKPGMLSELLRYENSDNAFSLTKSSVADSTTTSTNNTTKQQFENALSQNVCAYTVLVTEARHPKMAYEDDACDGGNDQDDYDGGEDQCDGLKVECDGSTKRKRRYHTNAIRGQKTSQNFNYVYLKYNSAPINIYNLVIFMK